MEVVDDDTDSDSFVAFADAPLRLAMADCPEDRLAVVVAALPIVSFFAAAGID